MTIQQDDAVETTDQAVPVERVLPVRRVSFEYPEDLPAMWAPHLPEFSAAANAISLGMPYAEPLFIRAMRSTFDRIDPELRARSESYIRQETGHHTQHKKFNDIVTAHYPALRHVQRLMAANDRWVWRRSPQGAPGTGPGARAWPRRALAAPRRTVARLPRPRGCRQARPQAESSEFLRRGFSVVQAFAAASTRQSLHAAGCPAATTGRPM